MTTAAPHATGHGMALARVEAALDEHGCGPSKAGFWRCPVPGHGKGRGDRHPSLSVGQGREGATLYCKAGCEVDAILDAIGLDWPDAFDMPNARCERTRSKTRPKATSAPTSTKREANHEIDVIGPPTAAQIETMIRGRRIANPETLARFGAQHVRARFRDAETGAWRGWGEYLGLPALGETWMLFGIRGDGGEWLDCDGKLHRISAGPCSLIVSPDLRERNGGKIERLYDLEGAPDLLAWIDGGGVAAIASTGGAGALGGHDAHAAKIEALDPAEVVVLRDLDDAGRKGGAKAADWYLHRDLAVRVPVLPAELGDGGDVRDFLMGRNGGEPMGGIADLDALADGAELREPRDAEDEAPARGEPARVYIGRIVLEGLANAPEPEWLVPPLLRPGKVTVIGGTTITGKSMKALQIGSAIAGGLQPWPGMKAVEPGPVVFLGYDPHMSVEDVARRLRHLDDGAHRRGLVTPYGWAERFAIVGHSEGSGPFPVDRYRLEAAGTERIAEQILRPLERQLGRLALITVDTFSTALPDGTDENDSAAMNAVMTRLSMLAIEFRASVLALHHPTKAASSAGERFNSWDPFSYFRGSSAIPSAAGVLAGLWAPPIHPQHRVLTCWSNSGPRRRWWFEVAEPDRAPHGWIDYFLPVDPPDAGDDDSEMMIERLAKAFTQLGDAFTPYQIAKKHSGKAEPSGAARKAADALIAWGTKHKMLEPQDKKLRLTVDGLRALNARNDSE